MKKEEYSNLVHEKIWDTISQDDEQVLKETIENYADKKNIPLYNPISINENHPDNTVMIQYFEWYLPDDGEHWKKLEKEAENLKKLGVGGVWLPPFCKATGTNDVGYGIYDLFDLGEFDQKGSIRTKYGTKEELKNAISKLHEFDIQAYGDIILNHKAGADETETFKVVKVDENNRNEEQSEPFDIEGWTKFTFPGRKGKYSNFQWNFQHFTGVNFDNKTGENAIFKILGEDKGFSPNVSGDMGNFDYLMFADIDYRNKDVINETLHWGNWIQKELNLDGMRLDAIKHIDYSFMESFITHVRINSNKPLYVVGEYWVPNDYVLDKYLNDTDGLLALFDVALHYRFVEASHAGRDYDLRTIFDNTLISRHVFNCSTFVDNHDSQPGQALESWVQDWFKPLAYALILLRQDGYPCVFYGDYYGIGGENLIPGKKEILDILLESRLKYAYGEQIDYFDHSNTIAWVRLGDDAHENSGLVCIMSNGEDGNKNLNLTDKFANTTWYDVTNNIEHDVVLDEHGNGEFMCKGGSLSVYVRK